MWRLVVGKYTSDIKKYYDKLGDLSGDKGFKDYTNTLVDESRESEGKKEESSKSTYPTPEKPKQTREKHKGAF